VPDYQTNPIILFIQHLIHAIRTALSSLAGSGKRNVPFDIWSISYIEYFPKTGDRTHSVQEFFSERLVHFKRTSKRCQRKIAIISTMYSENIKKISKRYQKDIKRYQRDV